MPFPESIDVLDAHRDVVANPTLWALVGYLGVTRFYNKAGTAMTRPATAVTYEDGDHIANSASAGSVTANFFEAGDLAEAPFSIEAMLLATNDLGPGALEAAIDVHIFISDPTASSGVGAGDGAQYTQKMAGWRGVMSGIFRPFSDGSIARLIPASGDNRIIIQPGEDLLGFWWQAVARGPFTSSSTNRTWTPYAEGFYGRA
jgi:hypothetical protein